MAKVDQFKTITLTQGVADAFVQTSVSTEIVPAEGLAWEITQIDFNIDATALVAVAADFFIEWSVTRDTKTGVTHIGDPDTIIADEVAYLLVTSGTFKVDGRYTYVPPAGTLFVEDAIYAQLDSNGTGVVNNAYMRIHYNEIKVSEVDILRMLQNS